MSTSSDFPGEQPAIMSWSQLFRLLLYVTLISYAVLRVFEALFGKGGEL